MGKFLTNDDKMLQNKENLKHKYKKQRLQQTKQVYLCECQKVYLSFAALYLHVKNKHNIKLTTKVSPKICKIQEIGDKSYITYFLNPQTQEHVQLPSQNQNDQRQFQRQLAGNYENDLGEHEKLLGSVGSSNVSSSSMKWVNGQKNLEHVIRTYLSVISTQYQLLYNISSRILSFFLNYIQKCVQSSKQFEMLKSQNPEQLLQQLPLFMNEFIVFYMPMALKQQKYGQISIQSSCCVIKRFSQWLSQERYTNLILKQNM